MSHVIILEGPDGGGKTTLANYLHDTYGYRIHKFNQPRPGEDLFTTYTQALLDAVQGWQPVVFDRHYLGESVYGPIMRGVDTLGEMGQTLIERLCAANGVPVILCLPTFNQLVKNWEDKKGNDYLKTQKQLTQVKNAYMDHAERRERKPWFRMYRYDMGEIGDRLLEVYQPLRRLPPGFSGSPEAKVLLVGDQVNPHAVAWDLPFHDLKGSSRYLYDRVESLGVHENDLAWVNSRDRGGVSRNLAECVAVMPNLRRVVALGESAMRVCLKEFESMMKEHDVSIQAIPHPQYFKRFKTGGEAEYQHLLKEAMGL